MHACDKGILAQSSTYALIQDVFEGDASHFKSEVLLSRWWRSFFSTASTCPCCANDVILVRAAMLGAFQVAAFRDATEERSRVCLCGWVIIIERTKRQPLCFGS